MSPHLWLLPEILYHLSEHLNRHQLSKATLVCHAWNNAFAPILWADIQLACCKTDTSASPPSLETLQARAPWMRSLTFHSHTDPTQFSLGRECRFLQSLVLHRTIPFDPSRGFDKAYSDSCRELIRQNRTSLRHLELKQMSFDTQKYDPGRPNWSPMAIFAFGKHTALRSLKVSWCRVPGQHREAFWTLCERLEVLEIDGGWYGLPDERSRRQKPCKAATTDILDAREDWITSKRFQRLVDLKLVSLLERTSDEYLRSIVSQCPRLRRLDWDCDVSTSFINSMMDYLTLPELRAKVWPDLESIKMHSIFGIENVLRVIESWPIGKLHNTALLNRRIPGRCIERLLEVHSGSLREVDLSHIQEAPRKWIHRFLELCPSLERVKCQAINMQPLVEEDRPPWVCDRLQEWAIYIDMDPRSFIPPGTLGNPSERQEKWCRRVFERLGRLRQLRVLDLRMRAVRNRDGIWSFEPKESQQLHLSLQMGLGELGRLHKLKEVYFQGRQTLMRRNDVQWMVEHWVNLEKIQGNGFSTRREAFAGKKHVWDWEYCRMFGEHHVKAGSESPGYPSNYLNPQQIERLTVTSDESF